VIASYPTTLDALESWAEAAGVTRQEARVRLAQYGVLRAIAASTILRTSLVLKGGNALDFVWAPNRSTRDLDFTATEELGDEVALRSVVEAALSRTRSILDTRFRLQKLERQPPGPDKTRVTWQASIGYAHRDDKRSLSKLAASESVSNIVPVEISLNDPVCEAVVVERADLRDVRVCTLEDIVAEKLRALLQQEVRNRYRPQDLLDIACVLETNAALDIAKVARFLAIKAQARDIIVSKAAFAAPELKRRTKELYAGMEGTTRVRFPDFDAAWLALLGLVARLDIPQD